MTGVPISAPTTSRIFESIYAFVVVIGVIFDWENTFCVWMPCMLGCYPFETKILNTWLDVTHDRVTYTWL